MKNDDFHHCHVNLLEGTVILQDSPSNNGSSTCTAEFAAKNLWSVRIRNKNPVIPMGIRSKGSWRATPDFLSFYVGFSKI